ncbi:hypothetical protein [Streptacidiphilus sp. P02-A3a]|uniref:hypothetical protein n=1 Tax=Streptacidiphilus sp. P02-A3a TaxID=2704468 RepID=UPI001CDC5F8F|nr:hypothetical protein [Streptacidiphilus sp. P02-A3a]QMU68037.1 hypothetical protein GXP74_07220 [Streptacidiphilus sp. P02-A3a]
MNTKRMTTKRMKTKRIRTGRIRTRCRLAAAALLTAVVVGPVSGCGSGAASDLASSATSAAGALGSSAASAAASAASSALGSIKDSISATADVKAAPPVTTSDGRTTSELTVSNPTSDQHTYTISVSFKNKDGSLLDVVVLTVSNVPGHATVQSTARSTHDINGATSADVTAAVRH